MMIVCVWCGCVGLGLLNVWLMVVCNRCVLMLVGGVVGVGGLGCVGVGLGRGGNLVGKVVVVELVGDLIVSV